MANYSYFYPGGTSGFDPNYGTVGYQLPLSQVGTSIRPDTAAQIVEVTNLLNQGFKQLEPGAISSQILDQVPKQHFDEIRRITKLTGAKASFHAPIQDIEASGIQEGRYTELNREITERKLQAAIDKAHIISPDRAIPVTMHSANMAGTEFVPGEKGDERFKTHQIVAINQETGEAKTPFTWEERYHLPDFRDEESLKELGPLKSETYSPERNLDIANASQWRSKIENISNNIKIAEEVIDSSLLSASPYLGKGGDIRKLSQENPQVISEINKANLFLNNVETSFHSMFEQAYKYAKDDEHRNALNDLVKKWREDSNKFSQSLKKEDPNSISYNQKVIQFKRNLLDESLYYLQQFPPQIYQKVEDFAMDKSATTFANVAMHSYEKYGKKDFSKAPIVSIENLYSGMAYSKPEEFQRLIKNSRDKFKEQLIKKDKISDKKAEKIANQIIGVTWDVGHLNMLRKQGFEEKDLVEATKLIGKDVKHVHLTDNFGYGDSHLAPGMGNVPFKQHLEELEKAGALNKDTMVINEIGGFVQQFRQSPFPYMLEGFQSPVVAGGDNYWNQILDTSGNYMQFPSAMLPDQHFSMYGSGFSTLPRELGGQVGNGSSRFSGAPNA
jgi:hypothetical protein